MKHIVDEVTLNNGIKGLLVHVPQASVMTFDINFRAGEYLVKSRKKWETPHLMEHLLLGANELIPRARTFEAEFEKNGAYNNASTGSYDIGYEAECADFEWDRVFGLLLTAITKPLFLLEEFEAEFGNVREELSARSNNYYRHLSLALREAYGFSVMTDQTRLTLMDNVTLDDIWQHYRQTHTSSNLRFVIAGKFTPRRRRVIEELLGAIELPKGRGRTPLPKELPKRLAKPLYIDNPTIDSIYFYIDTFLRRRITNAEADALNLLNTLLTETLHSRILGTAREQGLIYNMSSGQGQTRDSSNWWFGAQVTPINAQPLFNIMVRELQIVLSGKLSRSDIATTKQYLLGRYQRGAQTVGGISGNYAARYFFDEQIEHYRDVPKRIVAINKEAVTNIANDLFSQNIWGLGALSNCGPKFVHELHTAIKPLWQ